MRRLVFLLFVFSLVACTNGLIKKDNALFLHGNKSKLWLIDKMMVDDRNYVPIQFSQRELIVFHQNHKVFFYKMKTFGEVSGEKVEFYYNPDQQLIEFYSPKVEMKFKIKTLNYSKIVLEPLQNSYPYTLHLIPFPEF